MSGGIEQTPHWFGSSTCTNRIGDADPSLSRTRLPTMLDPEQPEIEDGFSLLPDDSPRRAFGIWWAVGAAFVALVGLVAVFTSTGGSTNQPATLADFQFQTPAGDIVTLADFEGKPMVVNYFASWCAPCRAELPDFETVHQEMGDEITFIGINRDNVTDSWLNLVDDVGVTYPTVFEGNIQGSFAFVEGRAMPTTVFLDADGNVQKVWSGLLSDDLLRELVAEHLT